MWVKYGRCSAQSSPLLISELEQTTLLSYTHTHARTHGEISSATSQSPRIPFNLRRSFGGHFFFQRGRVEFARIPPRVGAQSRRRVCAFGSRARPALLTPVEKKATGPRVPSRRDPRGVTERQVNPPLAGRGRAGCRSRRKGKGERCHEVF